MDQYKFYSRIDKMGSKVVELEPLEKKVKEIISEEQKNSNLIIVGHLAPEIKFKQDLVVVLRTTLKELIKRLEARKYEKDKIKENLVSESVDYCGTKAKEICKKTYEIETDQEKKEMIDYIVSVAKGKPSNEPEIKEISRFDELLELVTTDNKYGL